MLLEIFNILNNITPLISTTTQATLIFNNNNIDYFTNVLLLTKFLFLFLSLIYLIYLYFYLKKECTIEYAPNLFIPNLFLILLLTIVFVYLFFNLYFINPPPKNE
jgi:hypothetical protein